MGFVWDRYLIRVLKVIFHDNAFYGSKMHMKKMMDECNHIRNTNLNQDELG